MIQYDFYDKSSNCYKRVKKKPSNEFTKITKKKAK